jgi:hypothetical protein
MATIIPARSTPDANNQTRDRISPTSTPAQQTPLPSKPAHRACSPVSNACQRRTIAVPDQIETQRIRWSVVASLVPIESKAI